MTKRVVLLCVLCAFAWCAVASAGFAARTVSIEVAPGQQNIELQQKLVQATTEVFVSKGYEVVPSPSEADYRVTTAISDVQGDKKFSPLGCLACGIWGAAKTKAVATVSATITDASGKELFTSSATSTAEGSDIGGLFQGTGEAKRKAVNHAIQQLYGAFFLSHPSNE